jgi:hypothetical protein
LACIAMRNEMEESDWQLDKGDEAESELEEEV